MDWVRNYGGIVTGLFIGCKHWYLIFKMLTAYRLPLTAYRLPMPKATYWAVCDLQNTTSLVLHVDSGHAAQLTGLGVKSLT
jgi:hypothetical protein